MSVVDRLLKVGEDQRVLIARILVKMAALQEKIDELEKHELKRHNYAPDHPRDESGRALGTCVNCHREGVAIITKGWCRSCYMKHFRATHRIVRSEPLGTETKGP